MAARRDVLPFFLAATCPRCLGRGSDRRTCCGCDNTGQVQTSDALTAAAGFVWSRPPCPCYTCRHVLPPQPARPTPLPTGAP